MRLKKISIVFGNNMDFYNTQFYDKASTEYSNRRYKGKTLSYIQFFFKRRLSLTLIILSELIKGREKLRLLEAGCADGIIINTILKVFPDNFTNCVGTDISPGMIEAANKRNTNKNISYFLKEGGESGYFDFVLALGFLSPSIFDIEFAYFKKNIKPDGIIILTLASRKSIYTRLKLQKESYIKDYWTHEEYEEFLKKDFEILTTRPYGFFIPKLWAFPRIAVYVQPLVENIMAKILPNLFHEKLYVLKKRL
jgi:SAM-dependent methyltransferase